MIHLQRNTLNTVVITATELMSDPDNLLMITFTSEMDDSVTYEFVLGQNLSPARGRYDEFEIDLPNDVDLPLNGFYIYNVYELDINTPNDVIGLVETGRANTFGEYDTFVEDVYK